MNLTPHERDVIARCLNDYADQMDDAAVLQHQVMQSERTLPMVEMANWQADRAVQSIVTAEMRDIAFRIEWEGR